MYSTAPIPPIDTLHEHVGLYAILFILSLVVWIAYDEGVTDKFWVKRICLALVVVFAGYQSFTTGVMVTCDNEPVIGELITFIPEAQKSGKSVTHKLYTQYRVENTNIAIEMGNQAPQRAIFYKNTKPECECGR